MRDTGMLDQLSQLSNWEKRTGKDMTDQAEAVLFLRLDTIAKSDAPPDVKTRDNAKAFRIYAMTMGREVRARG